MRYAKTSKIRSFAPAALAAALAVGFAQAQQPQSTAAGNLNAPVRQQQMAQQDQSQQYHGLRASKVIGMDVRNAQGRNVGEIEDIVLNANTGNVRFAMLRFDPGIFSGERLFAVPMNQLGMAAGGEHITLDIQRDRLEQASVDRSAWSQNYFADLNQVRRIDEAWNVGQRDAGPVVRASDLLGKEFRGVDGRNAGTLEELVINAGRGQVHYAVAAMDRGWLGEERRVTLPLRAFQRSGDGSLTLNMNKGQVAGMRNFDQRQYGNLNDRTFLVDVDRYLVLVPVQTQTTSGNGSDTRSSGAAARSGAQLQTPQGNAPGSDVNARTGLQTPQQSGMQGGLSMDANQQSSSGRGVPAVGADLSASNSGMSANNGMPGMDADLSTSASVSERSSGVPGIDADVSTRADAGGDAAAQDTRTMGAGAATRDGPAVRAPIQDRN